MSNNKPLSRQKLRRWAVQNRLANKLVIILTIAAVLAGFVTYGALTTTSPGSTREVLWLLNLDLVILLLLGTIIIRQIVGLWAGRRRGLAGSRLHVRLVSIFSLLAAVPAILMAVFSATFFYFGVHSWFSDRVSIAVNDSLEVAEAYLEEHQKAIRADILAMANDLDREAPRIAGNPQDFQQYIHTQSSLRNLSEAIVFDSSGRVIARSRFSFSLEFNPVSDDMIEQAREGEVVLMTSDTDDRVRAIVKLDNYFDTFLFVGRFVEPGVLSHIEAARSAVNQYTELETSQDEFIILVTAMYAVVALLLMSGAVWVGLIFAKQMIRPISALITAAERVRAGDLSARVSDQAKLDEFGALGRTFDRMTSQLQSQRDDLVEANRLIDQRRRFIEAVLTGVPLGVIRLDADGVITLANNFAAELLGQKSGEKLTGQLLIDLIPDIENSLEKAAKKPGKITQKELRLSQAESGATTLLVRIAVEDSMAETKAKGMVITFDDISELQSAQRKAAWADVARRIAHEIKNPLTPIQLSAERLKRKYLGQITEDPETFSDCTDTIVRQVADIGRMVDEFSSFARMPEPVKQIENLANLTRESLFLQRQAHPDIKFAYNPPAEDIFVNADRRQLQQALTNLLQNAIDSITGCQAIEQQEGQERTQGMIIVEIGSSEKQETLLSITDNGLGLPDNEQRDNLTEPYVTTRPKGTGLGLAIVKKIMEDHEGSIQLKDREDGETGATIVLGFQAITEEEERKRA